MKSTTKEEFKSVSQFIIRNKTDDDNDQKYKKNKKVSNNIVQKIEIEEARETEENEANLVY